MTRTTFAFLACLVVTGTTAAGATASADVRELDITRVALFSSGVGYFEHDARVDGDATAELKFRTDQINDIIKSMVVQDFGGGKIGVISYASRDPIEKTLRSFGVDLTGKPSLGDLLNQLRGEPVEVSGARSLTGVIVDVEKTNITDPEGRILQRIERLTLLTESGLQQIELTQLAGIRLLNEKVDTELRKALATLAMAHDADKKSVTLRFEGMGERRVRVAYLLEAPIWKTSYRLVLTEEEAPFLQGWATVENATEEDWNNVRLSLISGRPISFRMDLYTPLYVPRPLEQLELYASLRPPEYDAGFEDKNVAMPRRRGMAAGRAGGAGEMLEMGAPPAPGAAPPREGEYADRLGLAETGVTSVATAQQAGELFEYRIDTPVTIPRQHSAMLPIVNQAIKGQKLSIYNPNTHPKYPLNGLEIENITGLHLMQGPVTVFDGNVYAGDAKLPDIKPNEKRLIAYALDLSTEVLVKHGSVPEQLVSLRIARGVLVRRHRQVDSRDYVVKNKGEKPRTVLLEQWYSDDWQLKEPDSAYERTQNTLRFKVNAAAGEETTQRVVLERLVDQTLVLSDSRLDQIEYYLQARVITPAVKEALQKVVELRTALTDIQRRRSALEVRHNEETAEQARIRENLKTLDKSTDAYRRQLQRFDEVDSRITTLAAQIGEARAQEETQRKALETYLLNLNVE